MSSKSSCSSPELQAKPPTLPQDVQHLPLYGIFTPSVLPPSDPLKALRRDAVANRAVAEQKTTIRNLRPLYETQLEQLEEFIGLQKNSQNLLKKNYAALRQAYFKKGKELEELRSRISGVDVVKLIAENKKLEDNCKKQMHLRLLAEDTVKKLTQIVKAKLTELAQCHDRLANLKHDKASLMAELKALKERQQHPRQPPPPPLELLTSSSEILSTERNTPSSVETRLGFESLGTPNSPPKFRRPPLPTQVVIPMDGSHKRCLSENPDVKPSAGAQLSVVSAPSKSSKNHNRSTSYPPCISIKDRHSENTASSTIPHPTVADKQGPVCFCESFSIVNALFVSICILAAN
ncbi:unnamed protein product [Calicophoron daubneyi]|uniref:Uncharacterized protein n=1 Tax=Calicophoron daubneyi TaxID=300641 RepID=A0AAV2THN5_CALDB